MGLLRVFLRKEIKVGQTLDFMTVFVSVHFRKGLAGDNNASFHVLDVDTIRALLHERLKKLLLRGLE